MSQEVTLKSILFPKLFTEHEQKTPVVGRITFGQLGVTVTPATELKLVEFTKLSRAGGPSTSRQAAKSLVASGAQASSKARLLTYLCHYGTTSGSTSAEIALNSGIPHPTVHKRLPDLRRDEQLVGSNGKLGRVVNLHDRVCTVTGRRSLTWAWKPTTL